ncbi:MAG: RNA pseudouridine synthase [Treponema sp.]|nr:RNA pseudouridine synthase [Treponema sp.]
MITVIHAPTAADPFLVIAKPPGLSSAPLTADTGNSTSALSEALVLFPELAAVDGKKAFEHGLLHRLDRATTGLLLIAATQEAYDALDRAQQRGAFTKSYRADCVLHPDNAQALGGFPPCPFRVRPETPLTVVSAFRAYGIGRRAVRPVTPLSGPAARAKGGARLYATDIIVAPHTDGFLQATCTITRGARHQVRCHLAWLGFPVVGDALYNATVFATDAQLHFSAYRLSFPHPLTAQPVTVTLP